MTVPLWLSLLMIGIPCGCCFGFVVLKSNAESVKEYHDSENIPKSRGAIFGDIVFNGMFKTLALFFVPSFVLLKLFNLMPLHDGYPIWAVSMLVGSAIGKTLRWWRWKKTCDFS